MDVDGSGDTPLFWRGYIDLGSNKAAGQKAHAASAQSRTMAQPA